VLLDCGWGRHHLDWGGEGADEGLLLGWEQRCKGAGGDLTVLGAAGPGGGLGLACQPEAAEHAERPVVVAGRPTVGLEGVQLKRQRAADEPDARPGQQLHPQRPAWQPHLTSAAMGAKTIWSATFRLLLQVGDSAGLAAMLASVNAHPCRTQLRA